ncbi:MAG: DUF2330 domain-containing protein [Armatimonadota bacterium]|nr:DUF2330 domain-containing protein [Armatimonadota bacterium]
MRICTRSLPILAALIVAASAALADGMFMPKDAYRRLYGGQGAVSTEQKGIIIELDDGREALLLQTTYQGPADEFAWIVPVPGEPGEQDVFIASSQFISQLLETTAPEVETHIETPRRPKMGLTEEPMMEAEGPMGGALPPTVTVHRRMEVGDYDVSVLSATGPHVLIDWLNEHGYATPTQHVDVIDHYVEKRWYFVALRVLPGVVEERPVLDDVKPIGIRFETDELVYPLYISRASSPQKTALTLVALTRESVECSELIRARLPIGEALEDTSYAILRRAAVERAPGPAAVLEYAGYRGTHSDTPHVAEQWPQPGQPDFRRLWATRLWTVLGVEEMVDLTFEPADAVGDRVVVERRGRLPTSVLEPLKALRVPAWLVAGVLVIALAAIRTWRTDAPREVLAAGLVVGTVGLFAPLLPMAVTSIVLVVICVVIAALVAQAAAGASSRDSGRAPARPWGAMLRWALLTAGWVGIVGVAVGGGRFDIRHGHLMGVAVQGIWQILWLLLAVLEMFRMARGWPLTTRVGAGLGALGLGTLTTVLAVANSPGSFNIVLLGLYLLCSAGAAGLVLLVLGSLRETARGHRAARVFAVAVLILGAVSILGQLRMRQAYGGLVMERHTGLTELDRALTELDGALLSFLEDTGSYPASLEDLTSKAPPEEGLDSSGNRVQVRGDYGGPYLPQLPENPLTGTRQAWVYEVTGAPMIDPAGLKITLRRESTARRPPRASARRATLPEYPFELDLGSVREGLTDPPEGQLLRVPPGEGIVFLARPRQHEAYYGRVETGVAPLAVSVSPDGRRVAFAMETGPASIRVCDLHARAEDPQTGRPDREFGRNSRELIPGLWPVAIRDIAWHPREQRWAVVVTVSEEILGNEQSGRASRVYIIDGEAPPQPVPGSDGCVDVAWTADGTGLIGLFSELPRYPGDSVPSGTVERIIPGQRVHVLARDVPAHLWRAAGGRIAAATRQGMRANGVMAGNPRVVMISPEGAYTEVAPPRVRMVVDDLLIEDGRVCVAWGTDDPEGPGLVTVYAAGDPSPTTIGAYTRDIKYERDPGRILIVGRDRGSDAWVVALVSGSRRYADVHSLYALRPDQPPERLVLGGADLFTDREARLDSEDVTVSLVGWLPGSAFAAGDLFREYDPATETIFHSRPLLIHRIDFVRGGEIAFDNRRISFEAGQPVLGRTEFFLKFRRVD